MLISGNPIKMWLLAYFGMQNSFLHWKQSSTLRFLRKMQKMKKNIYYHYFFIFCDFPYRLQAELPKNNGIMAFRWKETKFRQNGIDEFFWLKSLQIRGKNAYFYKSHKNVVSRVFWYAEFISAMKTESNPMVFEKNANNKIKSLLLLCFDFFVIFSKSYKQNCI